MDHLHAERVGRVLVDAAGAIRGVVVTVFPQEDRQQVPLGESLVRVDLLLHVIAPLAAEGPRQDVPARAALFCPQPSHLQEGVLPAGQRLRRRPVVAMAHATSLVHVRRGEL
eukprot:11637475-Heterocapsa_arctica.AAC.1